MKFPIKTCVICGEEFELRPEKPGFANHCPDCSTEEAKSPDQRSTSGNERQTNSEMNAERRKAIRDLLYRKDS